MADLVDVETWRRWLTSRRGRRCWQAWSTRYPSLGGWSPVDLEGPRWSEATDALQRDLVALAQEGGGEAAVTLLVQLRPGLLRLVGQRERSTGETRSEACDEVRGAFNETLYRHPLARRPRRIAANLVLDTRQHLNRAQHRVDRHRPPPSGLEPIAPGPDAVSPISLVLQAVERLPGSADSRAVTAEAAYRAWILEQPQTLIAAQLGLQPAAVARRLYRLRGVVRRELDRVA